MKKITLLLLLSITFNSYAQFPEGFETAVPPTGWSSFIGTNGEGTSYNWTASTSAASGSQAAYVRYESATTEAEDWLVTPQFTPSSSASILTFQQKQSYVSNYGNTYTVRVSTVSQTTHADFTIIDTQSEDDFGGVYSAKNIDLSAYNGTPIFVAFVMANNDGDNWYIDDVNLIADASAPDCASNPTPANGASNVALNSDSSVTISWDAATTGDAATGYEIFWGETSGSLSSLGILSATTVNITNIAYSTTYYWSIVPQNVGGSATGCIEWSFTSEDAPPPPPNDTLAGAIPITPNPQGTGCITAQFTLNFASDSTTDSGLDNSCNTANTGLDQFFTWTATTEGLLWNDAAPGNPGITIRDTAGNEIACAGTFAATDLILSGWNIGDDLIIQIYDYGTAVSNVAFCLEEYTPPPPPPAIVPNYTETFDTYLPVNWSESTGPFGSPSATVTSSDWVTADFLNDATLGKGAKVNIWGTGKDEYLISPTFDLSSGTHYLNINAGITDWDDIVADPDGMDVGDDYVAIVLSEDDGATWSELYRWDSTSGLTEVSQAMPEVTLSTTSTTAKIALYAFSGVSGGDYDFHVTNFQVTTETLGTATNILEGFTLYPTIVKEELNFRSQNNVEDITVFNLLGQKVFSGAPNANNSSVNLSTLRPGVYIVKVSAEGKIGSYKIIKE